MIRRVTLSDGQERITVYEDSPLGPVMLDWITNEPGQSLRSEVRETDGYWEMRLVSETRGTVAFERRAL